MNKFFAQACTTAFNLTTTRNILLKLAPKASQPSTLAPTPTLPCVPWSPCQLTGLDHFCVQSYDGQLSFFECEVAAFSRFLPSFLIPGPLCYCLQSDSFITCSAAMELECYKYKVLATATGEKSSGETWQQPGTACVGAVTHVGQHSPPCHH